MSKVVAIIQARLNSTRLPQKVLMDIRGKSALHWIIDAANAATTVDHVVVVTPDTRIMTACRNAVAILGPEDNVLERYKIAAGATQADIIVRLTADCPFVDPAVIDECVEKEACAVDEWPDGLDVQVFPAKWLPLGDKEHVVPVNNTLKQLSCPAGSQRHIKVTLDSALDLGRLRDMSQYLPKDRPPSWRETIAAYWTMEEKIMDRHFKYDPKAAFAAND